MFGLSKRERIKKMEINLSSLQNHAKHFYYLKTGIEENAISELLSLAENNAYTAKEAANTQQGKEILSEIVLNRQYALYYNELAIQLRSKIYKLKTGTAPLHSRGEWLSKIVATSGWDIVMAEIESTCGNLILDIDEIINKNNQ